MNPAERRDEADQPWGPQPIADSSAEGSPAWEMIDIGRYMPRRIRGSYLGRELG